jgi:hypothetical protein
MTLDDLLESGQLEGYIPEAPPGGLIDAAEVDGDVAAQATCIRCKHRGMDYRPFRIPAVSYRAFAVCPRCGEAHEF